MYVAEEEQEKTQGTAIILRESFSIFSISVGVAQDKNITLVKLLCEEGQHLLLMSLYIPPTSSAVEGSRAKTLSNLRTTLLYLQQSYASLPLVIFADANSRCRSQDQ